jgi:hypothetical protein
VGLEVEGRIIWMSVRARESARRYVCAYSRTRKCCILKVRYILFSYRLKRSKFELRMSLIYLYRMRSSSLLVIV